MVPILSIGRLFVAAAVANSVLALDVSENTELEARDDSQAGMIWTGSVFPGQEPITLHGDLDELYSQIFAINPNYVPEDIVVTEARLEMNRVEAAALSASDIGASDSKRDVKRPTLQTRAPQMSCHSQMALGLRARGLGDAIRLKNMGGACGAPRRDCRRMTCTEDTAAYICSEADVDASITCRQAGEHLENLVIGCACKDAYFTGHIYERAISNPYSVWGGYGHCWKDGNERPTNYPYPGGHGDGRC